MAGVVVLAGGTGGAKLARGLLDVCGEQLAVIANTGDDIEIHDGYVSPDPDLVTFWLADVIDERGWGLAGDTFTAMDALEAGGQDAWFRLGDRDLEICRRRAARLDGGARLTEAQDELRRELGVAARVLPMSDEPVRTHVQTGGEWVGLQQFLIRHPGATVEDVRFDGAAEARPSAEVLAALAAADAIVIGPSNPVISIGPILALAGMLEALAATRAAVVAVSPIVGGAVLKGPTDAFMAWRGASLDANGIADTYAGVIDGLAADDVAASLPALRLDTLLDTPARRREVAERVLGFAQALGK